MSYRIEKSITEMEFIIIYSFDLINELGFVDDDCQNEYLSTDEPRFLIKTQSGLTVGNWMVGAFKGRILKSKFDFLGLDYAILGENRTQVESVQNEQTQTQPEPELIIPVELTVNDSYHKSDKRRIKMQINKKNYQLFPLRKISKLARKIYQKNREEKISQMKKKIKVPIEILLQKID